VILVALVLISCEKDHGDKIQYEPEYLSHYEKIRTYSRNEIISVVSETEFSFPGVEYIILHDVKSIRIHYHTVDVDGNDIIASGALLVPASDTGFPVLSFQHGTIYDLLDAPSVSGSYYADLGAFLSSTGFITVMPDYLGYGASSHVEHPYQHRQSLATATRDMLRASYEYFKVEELTDPSDKLFLSGYSQGGYATMATLKLIQDEHSNEFNVTAATAGSGPYNITESVKHLLEMNEANENINTYVWVLDVYNNIYQSLNRPYNFYYNEPYASIIQQQGVFKKIETNPSLLFTEAFRMGIIHGSDADILTVLADNDIYSWRPNVPVQLYHGTNDKLVPFFNSQTAYDAMVASGAANIELKPVVGADHLSAFLEYMLGTFTFFYTKLAS
jgi:pimeloyl-ACP methyl ester carboxylesterase